MYVLVDLDTSTTAPSYEEQQQSLDPSTDDEDDDEEEPVEQRTAVEILQAGVAQGQLDKDTVRIDQCKVNDVEEHLIQQFVRDGCKCDLGPNKTPCCTTIAVEHYRAMRCPMLELTHDEHDLVVMGQVMAGCFSGETS